MSGPGWESRVRTRRAPVPQTLPGMTVAVPAAATDRC